MKFSFPKKKDEGKSDKSESSTSEIENNETSTDIQKDKPTKDSGASAKGKFGSFLDRVDKNKQITQKITEPDKRSEAITQHATIEKSVTTEKKQQFVNNPTPSQSAVLVGETDTDNDEVKKIIQIISGCEGNTINPSISFEKNQFTYTLLAEIGNDEYIASVLERLSLPTVGILEKGVYERIPVCPVHPQYLSTTLRLYCSACFSSDIVKLHLTEHKACGFITEMRDLGISDKITTCVSCKNTIKDPEKEIRRLGRWYECNKCKIKFDNCVIKLNCRQFNHDFDVNQASMVSIPNYKLKSDTKSLQVYSLSLIPQIKKTLESLEFIVQESSEVKGKSGISHKVSIYAQDKENKTLLIDIKGSEKEVVEDAEVNSMIIKVLDIAPTVSIFVGIPTISETAKTMVAAHNISVVTGKELTEILSLVENVLKTRLHVDKEFGK